MHPEKSKDITVEPAHFFELNEASIAVALNCDGKYRIAPHAHPHFELLYVLRGTRMVRMHGRTHRARGGNLIVFRPGEEHEEWGGSKRISFFVIRFYPHELETMKLSFPPTERIGPVIPLPQRDRFQELLGRIVEERKRPKDGTDLLLGAYLVEFVVLLGRAVEASQQGEGRGDSDPRARIHMAVENMRRNLTSDLNLEELARSAFMSVSHFSHVFKEATGESPKSYLIKERIEKAKQQLAETDHSAQEIAQSLGYESPYFFYRQFKQKTGMTTAEYRRQTRGD